MMLSIVIVLVLRVLLIYINLEVEVEVNDIMLLPYTVQLEVQQVQVCIYFPHVTQIL